MGKSLILALDQGTTSTRAIVFDLAGHPLATATRALHQSYPHDGWVEHDAEEIQTAVVAVLAEAVKTSGRPVSDFVALGITNQRETVVVWDKATGKPIHPAIVWQDRRTASVCDDLRGRGYEPQITQITGLLLDPYFSATKIAWILDAVPGARERAVRGELLAGTMDTWVVWNLTGGAVHATDATNASRTLLFDLERQIWSQPMLDLFGVPLSLLPVVKDTAADYGQIDGAILGQSLPISAVVGDQQGALIGQGCIHAGEMKATYGTGCFMLLNTGPERPISRARLLTTVAVRIDGQTSFALEGSIFVAGAAFQWLGEGLGIDGGPSAIEALAQTARPDHGVVVVPAFTGLGAPWWDADARGAILGLTRDAGLAEIAAATYDACAFQTRDLIEAMQADAPGCLGQRAELRIDGGMAGSDWFVRRLCDLTGVPVRRSQFHEMTALGAALLAGVGVGAYANLEAAVGARPSSQQTLPLLDPASRDTAYARWTQAVPRVRSKP